MNADDLDAVAAKAVKYDTKAIYISPREDLLDVARALVA
jgi:hypothetical protein